MKSLKSLIGIVFMSMIFVSCTKENIQPNTIISDDKEVSEKIHQIESSNELDFVFYVSNTNVNGTIKIYRDGILDSSYNVSDLDLEATTDYFGNTNDAFHIRKTIGEVKKDTQFQIVADFGREVDVHNENYINDEYMFRNNNRDFLEPSFHSESNVSTFANSAWVLPTSLEYERVADVK